MHRLVHRAALVSFVVGAGAYHAVVAAPSARGSLSAALQVALAVCMLVAWTSADACADTRRATFVAGLLARLVVAPISVAEVHDVQRYLWDGALAAAGLDPYRIAPDHPLAAMVRALWPTPAEHARYPTLYPPGALALFALAASAGPDAGHWVWKALVVTGSLTMLWAAERWLAARGQAQHLALIALSPLLLTECATGAHLDVVCATLVLGALRCADLGRWRTAGSFIGAGVLLKLSPALLLAPLVFHARQRGAVRLLVASIAVTLTGYGLAYSLEMRPLGSLPIFLASWRFGAPLYSAISALVTETMARWFCALTFCALVVVAVALARRGHWESGSLLALAAPFVTSPVVFPWYLVVLVPPLLAAPSHSVVLWMCAAPLGYEVVDRFEAHGAWQPATWPLFAIAFAWLVGGLLDTRRFKRQT